MRSPSDVCDTRTGVAKSKRSLPVFAARKMEGMDRDPYQSSLARPTTRFLITILIVPLLTFSLSFDLRNVYTSSGQLRNALRLKRTTRF